MRKYFYLHTNGELIEKPASVVESAGVQDYFNSPFVRKHWVATTERDIKQIKIEADILRKLGSKADGFKISNKIIDESDNRKSKGEKQN